MHQLVRSCKSVAVAVLVLFAIPGAIVLIQTPGVAQADVCVSGGRRVSVSGCADLADAVAPYVPPPSYYAPMPEDYPPPPPPPPPVSVCASFGRRISVSGCT